MGDRIEKYDILSKEEIENIHSLLGDIRELKNEIDSLKKTSASAKSIGELANNAEKSEAAIKKLTLTEQELNKQQKKLTDAIIKNSVAETETAKAIIKTTQETRKKNAAIKEEITGEKRLAAARRQRIKEEKQAVRISKLIINARNQEKGSVSQLSAVNKVLSARMAHLNTLIPEQAKRYAILSRAIDRNRARIASQMQTMMTGSKSATKGFNGLQFQVQQVARELPAMAFGINMFFAAISNNLPMLKDEMDRTRAANKLLAEQGKKTVPVWKQMASSIFSMQTALVVALTLFTIFGRDIAEWGKKVLGFNKKVNDLADSQKELNKTLLEGEKAAQGELVKLRVLYKAATNLEESQKTRNAAVEEMQKMYPAYLKNIDKETIKNGKASEVYINLTNSIIAAAKSRAAMSKIEELSGKLLQLDEVNAKNAAFRERVEIHRREQFELRKNAKSFSEVLDITEEINKDNEKLFFVQKSNNEIAEKRGKILARIKFLEESISVSSLLNGTSKVEDTRLAKLKQRQKAELEERKRGQQEWLNQIDITESERIHRETLANEELLLTQVLNLEEQKALVKQGSVEMLSILAQQAKLRTDIEKNTQEGNLKFHEQFRKEQQESDDDYLDFVFENINKEKLKRSEQATEELKSTKNKAGEKRRIEVELSLDLLAIERKRLEQILNSGNLEVENAEWVSNRIVEIKEAEEKVKRELIDETAKKTKQSTDEQLNTLKELSEAGFEFNSALNERNLASTERRYELETALAGDNKFKQLQAEKKYQQETAKLKRRQAIADKAQAAFNIILNTAQAIMKLEAQTGLLGIPLIPLIAGIGALQLAAVVAQPIPRFAEGVENFSGGHALVGDHKNSPTKSGGSELLIYPTGEMALSPSSPTVMNLPRGTDIIPNKDVSNYLSANVDMSDTNNHLRKIDKNTSETITFEGRYKIVKKKGFTGRYN